MNTFELPEIRITKNTVPLIYLDTNIMTELAKYENGSYKGAYLDELKVLYNLLNQKMRQNEIICPLGYQMEEMGMPAKRENARNFLYRFTNAKLKNPFSIEKEQADIDITLTMPKHPSLHLTRTALLKRQPVC